MRGGIHVDQRSLTGGAEGLGRLIKAYLSTGWIMGSMREWADDPVRPACYVTFEDDFDTNDSSILRCLIN